MITVNKYSKDNKAVKISIEELKSWNKDSKNNLLWIDMCNPTDEDAHLILNKVFNFHPLSIEDSIKYLNDSGFHFPKIDEFSDYLFIVFNETSLTKNKFSYTVNALSCFIGENFLITVHKEKSGNLFKRFLDLPNYDVFKRGADYLLHLLLDEIVDNYYPLLDSMEADYEKVEDQVFKTNPNNTILFKILNLKKNLLRLRRISSYQKDILFKLSRGDYKFVNIDESIYYRNVYDHLVSVTDTADTYRDLITGLLDSYLSIVNNKMNEVIKVLTIFAVILLPLTLITGIYGMNFEYIPMLHSENGFIFSIVIMAVIVILMLLWFKKKKWI